MATAELAGLVSRLETVVQKLEKSSAGSSDPNDKGVAQFVEDYDTLVSDFIDPYVSASEAVGGIALEQAKLFKIVSDEHRKFLVVVSKCSAPKDDSVIMTMTKKMSEEMGNMDSFKRKLDRKSNLKNHMLAACEGIVVFGWIGYPKTPLKHVEESKESVKFYTNKVLSEFKQSEAALVHKNWVKSYVAVFDALYGYIKDHHRTGPNWNAKAAPATEQSATSTGFAQPPPPPPPPPSSVPTAPLSAPETSKAPSDSAVSALLSDINRGTDVTKGLKKVTNDMKTYKNPELRKHHVPVPYKAAPSTYKPMNKAPAGKPVKPPKFGLQGKKWIVEYQEKANITVDQGKMNQTVYIYRCNNTTISVHNKVNSIVLDSCKKSGLVFSSVVSGVEVVNCQSVQAQAQGQMPTISIDKTDGCIVYLSKQCIGAQVVTAKSSEMNLSIPKEDGDFDEYPIVEQFRTIWDPSKKALVTVPSDQLG
ncbi:adenylyl cyclase-associated protein 2-like [Clavelina lepadiformis]|uniref:C-CAP/cofactor C-like domain-containing protein n=1 Tax=Clavelina lepadiformis TaxID=159417 RepID=A0ABP0GY86_CLALP